MAQVRLDGDVAAWLADEARAAGRSVSAQANHVLRAAAVDRDRDPRPVQPATVGRARAMAAPGPCSHPPNRRRGMTCLACGRRLRRP